MRRSFVNVVFGLLVAAALVLVALLLAVMSGHFVAGQKDSASPAAPATPSLSSARQHRLPPPPLKRVTPTQAAATQLAPTVVHITIAATRGPCWLVARRGSETGPILVQELLPQGQRITLRGAHTWLELGAAANVDIAVNGKAHAVPAGTTSMLLG